MRRSIRSAVGVEPAIATYDPFPYPYGNHPQLGAAGVREFAAAVQQIAPGWAHTSPVARPRGRSWFAAIPRDMLNTVLMYSRVPLRTEAQFSADRVEYTLPRGAIGTAICMHNYTAWLCADVVTIVNAAGSRRVNVGHYSDVYRVGLDLLYFTLDAAWRRGGIVHKLLDLETGIVHTMANPGRLGRLSSHKPATLLPCGLLHFGEDAELYNAATDRAVRLTNKSRGAYDDFGTIVHDFAALIPNVNVQSYFGECNMFTVVPAVAYAAPRPLVGTAGW